MDAILFSAKPSMVNIDDAIRHLADHSELYWEVGFRIDKSQFSFPMLGFMHISGRQVEYKVWIQDIVPFSPRHYESETLAERVKPRPWIREWREDLNDVRRYPWKNALVITEIAPYSYDTRAFQKLDSSRIQLAPRSYARVLPPNTNSHGLQRLTGVDILERNLEDLVVDQLGAIEHGLRLVDRQLSTPAGRMDLLCKDADGNHVVIELKRAQGTDQVVGQILRYMGWLIESHKPETVRGIIIVGRKDPALLYAASVVPSVQVKEFKLRVE